MVTSGQPTLNRRGPRKASFYRGAGYVTVRSGAMRQVTVYQYMVLDTNRVELRKARRWGTREAVDGLKDAQIIGGSATLIDEAILNASGFTPVDFDPGS
jgi:hypothetical protein